MNNIPELDQLLKEHEIFKNNIRWERQQRMQVLLARFFCIFATVTLSVLFAGPIALIIVPILWNVFSKIIPYPERKDPFKRYNKM